MKRAAILNKVVSSKIEEEFAGKGVNHWISGGRICQAEEIPNIRALRWECF